MARLALAAIVVIVLLGVVLIVVANFTRVAHKSGVPDTGRRMEEKQMQKVAFFLLIALIMYVSVSGGA